MRRIKVSIGETNRLRAFTRSAASQWVDISDELHSVTLVLEPAAPARVRVSAGEQQLADARLVVLDKLQPVAFFAAAKDGLIETAPFLQERSSLLVADEPEHIPKLVQLKADAGVQSVGLVAGTEYSGLVRTETDSPLAGARVIAVLPVESTGGAAFRFERLAVTGDDGTWMISGLPSRTRFRLAFLAPGFLLHTLELVPGGPAAFSDVVLKPAVASLLVVTDDLDEPVAGAAVTLENTGVGVTATDGTLNLFLNPAGVSTVLVQAEGHQVRSTTVVPPSPSRSS
jgi:hypothetical protein